MADEKVPLERITLKETECLVRLPCGLHAIIEFNGFDEETGNVKMTYRAEHSDTISRDQVEEELITYVTKGLNEIADEAAKKGITDVGQLQPGN